MGAPPKQLAIGHYLERFPGNSYNELVREWYRTQGMPPRNANTQNAGGFLPILAQNKTGVDLEYGHSAAIEGLAVPMGEDVGQRNNQQYSRPCAKAQKHTNSLNHTILGVAQTFIKIDGVGSFIIVGPAWLKCKFSDSNHHFARLKQNQTTFQPEAASSASGYPIMERETVTGTLPATFWALVFLGGGGGVAISNLRDARVTTAIDAASDNLQANWGSGQVKLLNETTGEEEGEAIPVKNMLRVAFVVDCQVEVDTAHNPPHVRNGSCAAVNWVSP
jgi:hypothetical protein